MSNTEESLERIANALESLAMAANDMKAIAELDMREEGYEKNADGMWEGKPWIGDADDDES